VLERNLLGIQQQHILSLKRCPPVELENVLAGKAFEDEVRIPWKPPNAHSRYRLV